MPALDDDYRAEIERNAQRLDAMGIANTYRARMNQIDKQSQSAPDTAADRSLYLSKLRDLRSSATHRVHDVLNPAIIDKPLTNNDLAYIRYEKRRAEEKASEAERFNNKLQKALAEEKKTSADLTSEIDDLDEEIAQQMIYTINLEAEVGALRAEVDALTDETAALANKVELVKDMLKGERAGRKEFAIKLVGSVDGKYGIKRTPAEIAEIKTLFKSSLDLADSKKLEVLLIKPYIEMLEEYKKTLKEKTNELRAVNKKYDKLRKKHITVGVDHQKLMAAYGQLKERHDELTSEGKKFINLSNAVREKLKARVAKLTKTIHTNKIKEGMLIGNSEHYQKEIDKLREKINELHTKHHAEYENIALEEAKLKNKIEHITAWGKYLQTEAAAAAAAAERAEKELREARTALDKERATRVAAELSATERLKAINALKVNNRQYEKSYKTMQSVLVTLNKEIAALKAEKTAALEQLASAKASYQEELNKLESDYRETHRRIWDEKTKLEAQLAGMSAGNVVDVMETIRDAGVSLSPATQKLLAELRVDDEPAVAIDKVGVVMKSFKADVEAAAKKEEDKRQKVLEDEVKAMARQLGALQEVVSNANQGAIDNAIKTLTALRGNLTTVLSKTRNTRTRVSIEDGISKIDSYIALLNTSRAAPPASTPSAPAALSATQILHDLSFIVRENILKWTIRQAELEKAELEINTLNDEIKRNEDAMEAAWKRAAAVAPGNVEILKEYISATTKARFKRLLRITDPRRQESGLKINGDASRDMHKALEGNPGLSVEDKFKLLQKINDDADSAIAAIEGEVGVSPLPSGPKPGRLARVRAALAGISGRVRGHGRGSGRGKPPKRITPGSLSIPLLGASTAGGRNDSMMVDCGRAIVIAFLIIVVIFLLYTLIKMIVPAPPMSTPPAPPMQLVEKNNITNYYGFAKQLMPGKPIRDQLYRFDDPVYTKLRSSRVYIPTRVPKRIATGAAPDCI